VLDHIGLNVRDYAASKDFYVAALKPLGYSLIFEVDGWGGFGAAGKPDFWIGGNRATVPEVHVAFAAATRDEVRAFYEAAMAAGGRDNGPPGPRPEYHPDYYGAFILDPDGHNIEAVCHASE
jgi:catechol 2,3-dioxygenase-like lactoylglutathione lyase family enzyme